MTKIAHICTSKKSHLILREKLRLLGEKGYEVHLISSAEGENIDFFESPVIHRHFINIKRSINFIDDLKSIFALVKLLRKERFSIVHTHTSKAGFVGRIAARLAGVPLIIHTCHGLPFYQGQSKFKYHMYKSLEIIAAGFCDYIGFQNNEDLKILEKYVDHKKLFYEGNGVNLKYLDAQMNIISDEYLTNLKRSSAIPEGRKIILVCARLEPVKDHNLLLQSLKLLRDSGEVNFYCLLAGNGVLEENIKKTVLELGLEDWVQLIGYQKNIYPWIKLSDLIMLTSVKEGLPRIIMEGMALGKAIVSTSVPGTRELVEDNVTGLLSPYGDARGLSANVYRLLNNDNLRKSFGAAGRSKIESKFSEELVIERILRYYTPVYYCKERS